MKRFSVEAVFKAIDRVTAPVNRMNNAVGKFTRRSVSRLKQYDRVLGSVARGVKRLAQVSIVAFAIAGTAMADVIKTGAQFEQSLVNASAKFGGIEKGSESFTKLENAAREAGRTTEFTASQSANALNELAKAGFSAEQAVAALPRVIDLATASETDLAQSTDIAVGILGAFNLKVADSIKLAENMARVNDVLARTTTSSKTTMETLNETMKQAGPPAHAAGASLETVAALAGKLGDANIDASLAGTTLKNMFLKLASPGEGASRILNRLGVETEDSKGNLRDIIDVLADLEKGLTGIGTAKRSAILKEVFDLRAISGANVLLGIGSDKLREYRKQLEDSNGAATTMAALMRGTLANSWKTFLSAVESTKISIFKIAEGPINKVVKQMTAWVRQNEKLIASRIGEYLRWVFDNPEKIFKWAKGVVIFIATLGTLIFTVKSLIAVITVFNLVMGLNPVGAIFLAIAGAVVAMSSAIIILTEATGSLDKALELIGQAMLKTLVLPLNLIVATLELTIRAMAQLARAAGADGIASSFDDAASSVQNMQDTMNKLLTGTKSAIPGMDIFDELTKKGNPAGMVSLENRGIIFADELADVVHEPIELVPDRQTVTPAQSVSKQITENSTKNSTEVTIKDETGRAAVTGPSVPGIQLMNSGGFAQ